MATRSQRTQRDKIEKGQLIRCQRCRCWVDLAFGADEPAAHLDASGRQGDPRSPGDWDDFCDRCYYTLTPRQRLSKQAKKGK